MPIAHFVSDRVLGQMAERRSKGRGSNGRRSIVRQSLGTGMTEVITTLFSVPTGEGT